MAFDLDRLERTGNLLLKFEAHAFAMLLAGAGLVLHGNKDEGQLIIGAALAVFKGKAQ